MIDIEELKKLAEAATSGPWQSCHSAVYFGKQRGGFDLRDCPRPTENAAFIAAANPQTVLALIAENAELSQKMRQLELDTAAVRQELEEARKDAWELAEKVDGLRG